MSKPSLNLQSEDVELIMWDGNGTAYMLAREMYNMPPRTKAITLALLKLAVAEMEAIS